MIDFKRVSDGLYQSEDGSVIIKRVISQRNSGRRTEKEIVWTIRICGYDEPFAETTLRDAKASAWDYLKKAFTEKYNRG